MKDVQTSNKSMYVGKRLRQLRLSLDLNQEEMASKLSISMSYYTKFETGKRAITENVLNKIESTFKVTKDNFLKGNINKLSNCPHCGKSLK